MRGDRMTGNCTMTLRIQRPRRAMRGSPARIRQRRRRLPRAGPARGVAARGAFVIMGDADGSYDFLEIPRFLEKHGEGYELVQGCRLPSGGGTVLPGAMPLMHRWLGNPLFTLMVRAMFRAPIHDIYCGL